MLKSPTSSEEIQLMSLRVLQALCVSYGYKTNSQNQLLISKHGGLAILLDFTKRPNTSKFFQCQVYYTLSMVCLGNPSVRGEVLDQIEPIRLIKTMHGILTAPSLDNSGVFKSYEISNDDIEAIATPVTAGLIICGFCYQNEGSFCLNKFDFKKKKTLRLILFYLFRFRQENDRKLRKS